VKISWDERDRPIVQLQTGGKTFPEERARISGFSERQTFDPPRESRRSDRGVGLSRFYWFVEGTTRF